MSKAWAFFGAISLLAACGGGGGSAEGGNPGKPGLGDLIRDGGSGNFTPDPTPTPTPNSAMPVGGCVPDGQEPNDSPAAARTVAVPATLTLNFCDDAADYFRVGVTPGSTLTLETSSLGTRTDTVLRVLRNGTELAFDDDGGQGLASRIVFDVPSGVTEVTVFVSQFDGSSGPNREYTLSIAQSLAGAALPDFVFAGSSFITQPSDARQFEFRVNVGNVGAAAGAMEIGFYLSEDDTITSADTFLDFVASGTLEPGAERELRGTINLPEIRGERTFGIILDDLGQVAEQDEQNNTTRFARMFVGTGTENCIDDFAEPDDSMATAAAVAAPADLFRRHCTDGVDWIRFPAVADRQYVLTTTRLGPSSDTILRATDAQGTELVRNDDFVGLSSAITFTALRSEDHFVEISHFDGAAAVGRDRNYEVSLRENDGRPDLLAAIVDTNAIPATLQANAQITVRIEVGNVGLGNAPASQVQIDAFEAFPSGRFLDNPRSFGRVAIADVPALGSNQTTVVTTTLTVPDFSGRVEFAAFADSNGAIDEAVESNGVANSNQAAFLIRTVVGGSGMPANKAGLAQDARASTPLSFRQD